MSLGIHYLFELQPSESDSNRLPFGSSRLWGALESVYISYLDDLGRINRV